MRDKVKVYEKKSLQFSEFITEYANTRKHLASNR